MSANIEYALVTRVIQDQDFHTLEKLRITSEFFTVPEMKNVFEWMQMVYHHPNTPGQVPSLPMVQHYFKSFVPAYAPDTVPVLCEALRREKLRMDLSSAIDKVAAKKDQDPFSALGDLKVETQRLSGIAEAGQDLAMASAYKLLMDRYTLVSTMKGVVGIPYPWQLMNEVTQGRQGGQFFILYGRPKSMKSWLAIYMAVHSYMHSRRRVLFYTREMPPMLVAQRVAAAICGLSYKHIVSGTLQPDLLAYFQSTLQGLIEDEKEAAKHGHQPCFIITTDTSSKGGGVNWLRAKIREVQPDEVYVDGMYLMKDDRSNSRTIDWKNIAHISQDLKLTSQEFDIPVTGVTQANRSAESKKGEDLTELSYSDAIGQDTDLALRVRRVVRCDDSTGGVKKTEIHLTSPGFREGVFDGMVIHGEPATDFSFIRPITAAEIGEDDDYQKPKEQAKLLPQGATYQKKEFLKTTPKIHI